MDRNVVYKASPPFKTFKACRTCRQQKSRCIVLVEPPCQRCQTIGRDCIFEELEPGRKRTRDAQHSPTTREVGKKARSNEGSTRQDELELEVAQLRQTVARMQSSSELPDNKDAHERPQSSDSRLKAATAGQVGTVDWAKAVTSSEDLKLLRFGAPLAVVNAMIPGSTVTSPSSVHSTQDSLPESALSGAASPEKLIGKHGKRYNDVISRGIISESKARSFFQSYMANANVFLPVFDSTVDTFDTVRSRSNLLFTVVIAIASKFEEKQHNDPGGQQHECFEEARTLAGNSLFSNSHSLETVQALLLLSAYSEQNWFAISHTYKISREIGLSDLLPRQSPVSEERAPQLNAIFQNRRLTHAVRTALLIHQVELEAATGTARPSKSAPVSEVFLKDFINSKFSSTQDVRIAATIGIVQIRDRLLKETEDQLKASRGPMTMLEMAEQALNEWYKNWAIVYQERNFILGSFQRSSLSLQRDYAFILISSNMISTLIKESPQTLPSVNDDELGQLIDATLARIRDLIQFIVDSQAYRWHLQWAPTYSAIFPVFVSALAYRLINLRPGTLDWRLFQSLISEIEGVLSRSPYRNFAVLMGAISKLPLRPMDSGSASRSRTMPSSPSATDANQDSTAIIGQPRATRMDQMQKFTANKDDLVQQLPETESMHEPALASDSYGYYGQFDDANREFLSPSSSYHYPEGGPIDNRGISNMFAGQDFMFDYRSFTASAQAFFGGSDIFDFSLPDSNHTD